MFTDVFFTFSLGNGLIRVDPTVDQERRTTLTQNGGYIMRIYQQAALPAKDGGLSLPTADLLCASAHLAGACATLPYVQEHADAFCLGGVSLDAASPLPYFHGLANASFRVFLGKLGVVLS